MARAAETDPRLGKALKAMARAGRAALVAKELLYQALRILETHPEKGEDGSLAWWARSSAMGALEDASVEDVPSWLANDSDPARLAASLREFKATERRDARRLQAA